MAKDFQDDMPALTKHDQGRKSPDQGAGRMGGFGLAAAGIALTADMATAQATIPEGFQQLGSDFTVSVAGDTATITGGGTTIQTAASNVVVAANGTVFVAAQVAEVLAGVAVGIGGAGVGLAAAGGLGLAAGALGGSEDPVAPVVSGSIPNATLVENADVSIATSNVFSDANGDVLTYTAQLVDGSPLSSVGLAIDPTTGQITGTLTGTGAIEIAVTASDGITGAAATTFEITVAPNTNPAVVTGVADTTLTVGDAVNIATNITDADPGDSLDYSLNQAALDAGLGIDANGLITGTVTGTADVTVVVTATDNSGQTVSDSFVITVNEKPVVDTGIANVILTVGDAVNISSNISDPDGDTLSYSLNAAAQTAGLSIDTNGVITGTLTGTVDVPVVVTAQDPSGQTITDSFTITVNEVPTLETALADVTYTEGETVNIDVSGAFADADGDTLTYAMVAGPVGGGATGALSLVPTSTGGSIEINTTTGVITGTMGNSDLQVEITAFDTQGKSVSDTFIITANEVPVVDTAIANVTLTVGSAINIQSNISDPDGDTLTYSLNAAAEAAGMSIDTNGLITGTLTGTADVTVEVKAEDPTGASVTDSFVVTVNETPVVDAPVANQVVPVGQTATFTVPSTTFSDPDGDTLTLSAEISDGSGGFNPLPSGTPSSTNPFTFDPATGAVDSIAITSASEGETITIRVTADDGNGATVTDSIDIIVPGPVPQITNSDNLVAITENTTTVAFTATADQAVTWSLTGADAGLFAIDSNGVLSVAPGATIDAENHNGALFFDDAGNPGISQLDVVVVATNGTGGTDSYALSVEIGDVSELPSWLADASEYGITDTAGADGYGVHTLLDADGDQAHWQGDGSYNTPTVITYSYVNAGGQIWPGNSPFNASQGVSQNAQDLIEDVFASFSNVANITFTEVPDVGLTGSGDIRVSFITEAEFIAHVDNSSSQAPLGFAFQPGNSSSGSAQNSTDSAFNSYIGDMFIVSDYVDPVTGYTTDYSDENNTLSHELGHAMGLDHPFNSNGGNNAGFYPIDSNLTATNYTGQSTGGGHQSDQTDNMMETIMTYHNPYRDGNIDLGGGVTAVVTVNTPWTPGIQDIAALQHLYGANMDYNAGDTVYTYSSDTMVFDVIWDAGGNDAIVHTGIESAFINLNEGAYSTLGFYGGATYTLTASDFGTGTTFDSFVLDEASDALVEISSDGSTLTLTLNMSSNGVDDDLTGTLTLLNGGTTTTQTLDLGDQEPDRTHMTGNVGIAYGVIIEDAFGGDGDDEIIGNGAGNFLDGGAGSDMLFGGAGLDELVGGAGDDQLTGGSGVDLFTYFSADGAFDADQIMDFALGTDVVVLNGFTAADFTVTETGGNTVFDAGGGNTITVLGVTGLTAGADYIFL